MQNDPPPATEPDLPAAAPTSPRRRRRSWGGWALALAWRGALATVSLAVLALAIGYLRLLQGPVQFPLLGTLAAAAVNANQDRFDIVVGDASIALRRDGTVPAVLFQDVAVRSPTGATLMSVPQLRVALSLPDLAMGRIRPTAITLSEVEARVVRTRAGRLRLGLGAGGMDLGAGTGPAPDDAAPGPAIDNPAPGGAGADAVARVVAGLVGMAEPLPELSRLVRVNVLDAVLTYDYAGARRIWRTREANLRLRRADGGAQASLAVTLEGQDAQPGAQVLVEATRRDGVPRTDLDIGLRGLAPVHLAEQLSALAWLRLIQAPMDADLHLAVGDDGSVAALNGRITAGPGTILGPGPGAEPFERAEIAVTFDPARERMRLDLAQVRASGLDADFDGFFDLRRGPDGAVVGLAAQLGVRDLGLRLPELFSDPLSFDSGQVVGRLTLDPLAIEVVEARLERGALAFALNGRARLGPEGWHTQARASAQAVGIDDLIAHWPLPTAVNARAWVAQNLSTGRIDDMVAHLDLTPKTEDLSLDFRFSDLTAQYLPTMSPITDAAGQAALGLEDLVLDVTAARIAPPGQAPLDLGGSRVRIYDFAAPVTPADITVRGQGAIPSVLALIDQPPLGLVSRLGADLSGLTGTAEITAELDFPLVEDLALEAVGVTVEATLTDVDLPLAVGGSRVIDIAADRIGLTADTTRLAISGPARIEGTPVTLDWTEAYGGAGPGERRARVTGQASPGLLARLDIAVPWMIGGEAPATFTLAQTGAAAMTFGVEAALGPADLAVPELAWAKPPGAEGTLQVEGTFGDVVTLERVEVAAAGLTLGGAVTLDAAGGVATARFDRLVRDTRADLTLDLAARPGGGYSLDLRGRHLDLGLFDDPGGAEAPATAPDPAAEPTLPIDASFALESLTLTPRVTLVPARGTLTRARDGAVVAAIQGDVGGQVPIAADYAGSSGGAATLTLTAADAGALLSTAGLFEGGRGGALVVEATIPAGPGAPIEGVAQISDITLSRAPRLQQILDEGALDDAARIGRDRGIGFDRIRVPFSLRDGVITLGTSVAAGPLLAIKLDGTVDQASGAIDLAGVISPAYGLTGLLDNIPLIGEILSGGRGEGIFALTFQAGGTLENSSITVNPLSLLTPGILREVFSGRTGNPDQRFLDGLERN